MSISSEITRISGNVSAALTAIGAKGVTVPSGSNSDDLASLIAQIETGGGTTTEVIFPEQSVTATTADSSGYTVNISVSENLIDGANYIVTMDGTSYLCYANNKYGSTDVYVGDDNNIWGNPSQAQYPFCVATWGNGVTAWGVPDTSAHTVKIEKVLSYDAAELTTKSITANGTYSASDDSADGYSSVTVNVPSGVDIPVFTVTYDPDTGNRASIVCNKTFSQCLDYINDGKAYGSLTQIWDASYSSYETVVLYDRGSDYIIYTAMGGTYPEFDIEYDSDGTITVTEPSVQNKVLNITQNGTTYPTGVVTEVNVNVPLNVNVQTAQTTDRRNDTVLSSIISLTCSTAGTYDVYWTCDRSTTGITWGSQLYINGTPYGTENTTWSNHVQNNHLTGVTIPANATVAVYGRSRSTNYYIYAPQLTIVQTA